MTLEPDLAQTEQEENENIQSPRRNMSTGTSGEAVTWVGHNAQIGPICNKLYEAPRPTQCLREERGERKNLYPLAPQTMQSVPK